ncbi:NHS-like protein 3 [Tiliqua scincoides]|uniref:NHS-like protein 3 n=1 Tax=Tiliqua scincoides TaxID=71010 RepID=UPI003461F087
MVVLLGRHLPSLLALFQKRRTGAAKAENGKRLSVQYKAGEEQPDNVFFPSSRPPHLEELHIQAQAGLKSLQNQEKQKQTKRAWDHSDTGSIQSSRSSAEGDDLSIQSKTPSCSTETASEDALSVRSEMIQRKGSTFRPHDSFPKSLKGEKRRRERRTTVLGLPQHVQEELGLSNGHGSKKRPGSIAVRVVPPAQPLLNGAKVPDHSIHIPTIDGKLQPPAVPEGGARVSLQALEAEKSDSALQRHINRLYYDDSLLGRKTAAKLSPLTRPKSLAVPWMTTQSSSPELLRPVMSISPQGTYLSKIIPNAIMPPMVDVIAISRNRVRTLSRCSLATASPASVRSVGRFPSMPGSREHSSSSDNWSHSQSTETIVSNTSTISSQGGTGSRKSEAGPNGHAQATTKPDLDQLSAYSFTSGAGSNCANVKAAPPSPRLLGVRPPGSSGRASPAYSTSSVADGSDSMSVRSDRSSTRSVSLRKLKKAPAPPRRTYSLHQKAQQLEAEGAPRVMGLPPKPERRPQRESSEAWALARLGSPGLAGEDDVFSPSSQSETSSLRSDSLVSAADVGSPVTSRGSPLTLDKLHEEDRLSTGRPQEPPSKQGSPDRFGRTMSPSSGYSSQSGTPTLHTKDLKAQASSPGRKRPQPKKPERGSSLQSPGLSVSSSLTSLSSSASDPAPAEMTGLPATCETLVPSRTDTFVIPPHPKVPAPFSPPPTKPQLTESNPAACLSSAAGQAHPQPSVLAKPGGGSPPPSPPPAYHPPPPPAKKPDASPEPPASSETEPDAPPEPLWPPPPPPLQDEHDLSMANFPPPEEAFFSPPAPSEPQLLAAAGPPPANTTEAPSALEQPANQRSSAEEARGSTASPSFSSMVSSKIQQQQQGALDPSALLAPRAELPLPPKLPAVSLGDTPGSQPSPRTATAQAPLLPSGLSAQPSLNKPVASSPRQDPRKEPASRSKSSSTPKEDASLPIVTPSLLQMVRLRSVNMGTHGPALSPAATQAPAAEQNGPSPASNGKPGQPAPQKPIRKALSLRVPPSASQGAGPSNLLHNAVRLKAATLSSRETPNLSMVADRKAGTPLTLPASSAAAAPSLDEARDSPVSPLLKSPASTASFIFAKSPKKLVIETPSLPEAQASLQKSLVAELMTISGQRSMASLGPKQQQPGIGKPQAQKKPQKVPPPIAKKPLLAPSSPLPSPQSPKPPGAEELSDSLPAVRDRTEQEEAVVKEAGRVGSDSPPAGPEAPPTPDTREETA